MDSDSALSTPPLSPISRPCITSSETLEDVFSSAAATQPLAMNEVPHASFMSVYIHTAKCDRCEERNSSVLQRCRTCTAQFCRRCMEIGDGIHALDEGMDWTDYGAQANSAPKRIKTKKQNPSTKTLCIRQVKPTSATQSSARQSRVQDNQPNTVTLATKAVRTNLPRAPKKQKTATNESSDSDELSITVVTKDTSTRDLNRPGRLSPLYMLVSEDRSENENNLQAFDLNRLKQSSKRSHLEDSDDDLTAIMKRAKSILTINQKKMFPKMCDSEPKPQVYGEQPAEETQEIRSIFQKPSHLRRRPVISSKEMKCAVQRLDMASSGSTSSGVRRGTETRADDMRTKRNQVAAELARIHQEMAVLKAMESQAMAKEREIDTAFEAAAAMIQLSSVERAFPASEAQQDDLC